MTGRAYCCREHSLLGRARTRAETGGYSASAMRKAQLASQQKVLCQRGCGAVLVAANLARHEATCLHPRTWARFAEIGKLEVYRDCLLWRRPGSHYGAVGGEHAHRTAWELANKLEVPQGLVVRHSCDRKGCVAPGHLLLGTVAENSRDAVERGQHYGFESWPKEKLEEMLKTKRWKRET